MRRFILQVRNIYVFINLNYRLIVSCALVLLMTPGLAFFYGGMVQVKNVITTLMLSYTCIALITLLWVFFT